MQRYSRSGWIVFGVAFAIALVQIFVAVSKTTDKFLTSTYWSTAAYLAIAAGLGISLYSYFRDPRPRPERRPGEYTDPGIVDYFTANAGAAPFWTAVRLWVAPTLFIAGWHKFQLAAWTHGGTGLATFWKTAITNAHSAKPTVGYLWYADFLQFMLKNHFYTWFAWIVVLGEMALGVALLFGAFTGIAGAVGAFMNLNYGMAGAASLNPMFMLVGILLFVAGRVAGHYGLDAEFLPALGTPWQPGWLFQHRPAAVRQPVTAH